jgi:hypothetical protein
MAMLDTVEQDGENILLYFSSLWVEVLWLLFPLLYVGQDCKMKWGKKGDWVKEVGR